MHLKEIHMENFKSFGRKVKVPFTPGFTGITGPNGSGKSNISDGILFVLGPRSSKVIRAGKLSDLIFNGGKTGRPATQCKVSLVFDNTDRIIQVDADEVTLTRVVRRTANSTNTDANSYFYINGAKSSLSQFSNLLSHARISADGYNFTQQGDVNHIANMGPIERRRILDGIAGISRFDDDINKAEKKKVIANNDIERINLLLDEIQHRVASLDGERTEATKYLELKETFTNGEAMIVYKRLKGIESEAAALTEQMSKFKDQEVAMEEEKKRLNAAIEEVQETIDKLEKEMSAKGGKDVDELREKLDKHRLDRARASDSMEDGKEEVARLKTEKKRLTSEKKKVAKEIEELEAKIGVHREAASKVEEKLKGIRGELKALEEEAAGTDSRVDELRKEETSLMDAVQTRIDETSVADVESEKIKIDIESKNREKAELEEKKIDLDAEIKDADWEMKELKKEGKGPTNSKKLQEELYSKKAQERRLTQDSTDLENSVKRLEREYEKTRTQVEMSEKTAMGYTQPVMAVLEARDKGELSGIHGTVGELVSAENDVETALTVSAGNRMQSLVCDSDADAENAINYLRSKNYGRATFLPLNKMLGVRPRGKALMASKDAASLGFALDLIRYDDRYHAAMCFVFGDTVVVKSLKDARRMMGGVRLVTLQGELIEASGAMVGGTLAKKGKSFGVSRGELDRVGEELRKSRDQADSTLKQLQMLRTELVDLETRLKEASGRDGQHAIRFDSLKNRKDTAKKEMDKVLARIKEVTTAISKLEHTLEKLESNKSDLDKKAEDAKKLLSNVREALAKTTPKEVGDKLRKLRGDEKEEVAELARIRSLISEISPTLAVAKNTMKSLEKAMTDSDASIDKLKGEMKAKEDNMIKADIEVKALSKMLSSMSAEIEALRLERDATFKKKMELEKEKEKVLTSLENKEDFYLGLKAKLTTLEEQNKTLSSEWEEYSIELPEKLPSMESLKKSTQTAKIQMEAMGAVNLKALDEYDKQKARYDKLSEELKQVKSDKKNLEKLVDDLIARKTEGLMKVYHSVNENFKAVYARLSMGGDAEIILENPDNPFEGGLLISARPPGKKVLRLEALSGGEKSLVSMGFIISLQQYDPSPFYLLDEVDQNLDAINAENLARHVKEDSQRAQFIMISLRKVTLKEADNLYGVMIQKNGLSELVGTVDLQKMKEPEPKLGKDPEDKEEEAVVEEEVLHEEEAILEEVVESPEKAPEEAVDDMEVEA